jgi:hypothetical protein
MFITVFNKQTNSRIPFSSQARVLDYIGKVGILALPDIHPKEDVDKLMRILLGTPPEFLKEWRERHDWTQAEAAYRLGLSLSGYTHKEQGIRKITTRDISMMEMIDEQSRESRQPS